MAIYKAYFSNYVLYLLIQMDFRISSNFLLSKNPMQMDNSPTCLQKQSQPTRRPTLYLNYHHQLCFPKLHPFYRFTTPNSLLTLPFILVSCQNKMSQKSNRHQRKPSQGVFVFPDNLSDPLPKNDAEESKAASAAAAAGGSTASVAHPPSMFEKGGVSLPPSAPAAKVLEEMSTANPPKS